MSEFKRNRLPSIAKAESIWKGIGADNSGAKDAAIKRKLYNRRSYSIHGMSKKPILYSTSKERKGGRGSALSPE